MYINNNLKLNKSLLGCNCSASISKYHTLHSISYPLYLHQWYTYVYVYLYLYACMCVYVCVYCCMCVCVCVCVYVCVYACVYVCVSV